MTSQVLVETGFRTTRTSNQREATVVTKPLPKEGRRLSGERLIGVVFAASALGAGGWFFWVLARTLETYRVY